MEVDNNTTFADVKRYVLERKEREKTFKENVDFHVTNPRAKYQQNRRWMFTCNNPEIPPEQFLTVLKTMHKARYVVFQLEKGKLGTPHYQGYIEFKQPIRRRTLLNVIKMWYEPARGTQKQCITYCTKTDTQMEEPWEWGEPTKQGTRTDLISFRDEVSKGATARDLIYKYPTIMALYPGFYNRCNLLTFDHYKIVGRHVILCIGAPGTGKTEWARAYSTPKDTWCRPIGTNQWFDGYDGQDVAVIDDYGGGGSKYKLTDLLRLTHAFTETVPVKNGFTHWRPETIIFTTNYHPSLWYNLNPETPDCGDVYGNFKVTKKDRRVSYEALARRFTEIIEFRKGEKPRRYKQDAANFFFDRKHPLHPEYCEVYDAFDIYFKEEIEDKFEDMDIEQLETHKVAYKHI